MYISNDSVNWARYDVNQASINATPVTNPSVYEVSVSNVAEINQLFMFDYT